MVDGWREWIGKNRRQLRIRHRCVKNHQKEANFRNEEITSHLHLSGSMFVIIPSHWVAWQKMSMYSLFPLNRCRKDNTFTLSSLISTPISSLDSLFAAWCTLSPWKIKGEFKTRPIQKKTNHHRIHMP